jgi:hypothetical protein
VHLLYRVYREQRAHMDMTQRKANHDLATVSMA